MGFCALSPINVPASSYGLTLVRMVPGVGLRQIEMSLLGTLKSIAYASVVDDPLDFISRGATSMPSSEIANTIQRPQSPVISPTVSFHSTRLGPDSQIMTHTTMKKYSPNEMQ